MSDETAQIRRLKLGMLAASGVAVAGLVVALLAQRRISELESRTPTSEVKIGSATLSKWGIDVGNYSSSGKRSTGLKLQALDASAHLALGARQMGVTLEIPDSGKTVRLDAFGNLESVLEIDTETGAWNVARTLRDVNYKVVKEDRVQLIAPMTP